MNMTPIEFEEALENLRQGKIILYPTDTLYALGVDIDNVQAIERLYELKVRAKEQPFSIGVADITQMKDHAYVTPLAEELVKHFLPGPLTIILKKKQTISNVITANKETVAVRIPDQSIALRLYKEYGPLTITSANVHGHNATTTKEVINQIGTKPYMIDIGPLKNKASTIVDATINIPRIVRKGEITMTNIKEAIGYE